MTVNPFLFLFVVHVYAVLFALAVIVSARRRLRTTAVAIGVVIAIGIGIVWLGATLTDDDFAFGMQWYRVGFIVTVVASPAWLLIGPARDKDKFVGHRAWINLIGAFVFAIWMLAFFLAVVLLLTTSPPGSLR